MRAGVHRVSPGAAAVTARLLVLAMGCSDGSGITAPLPAVEGMWSVIRMVESAQGCGLLLDPAPIQVTFHATGSVLELEIPASFGLELSLMGSLQSGGDFQVHWEHEEPGFSSETTSVQGRFSGDFLTAIQSSEVVYLDPEFIEIFGIERCASTIRWEGERV
jgi:hypothetical protein